MPPRPTLKSIRLINYKGFEDHTVSFRATNVLIGANNAGKSTALGALRLIVAMLPTARRTNPTAAGIMQGRVVRGWPITAVAVEASAFSSENIRHDFRPQETRIEVRTSSGARLVAAWASVEEADEFDPSPPGMFFVLPPTGSGRTPRQVAQEMVPSVAVVPTLTPLDDHEAFVGDDTLRRHVTSRRSSRYFRNALSRLDAEQWRDFTSFVYERTPEIVGLRVERAYGSNDGDDFDLFYGEERTRHEREIGWAGDGIQIWLQALYHLWRQAGTDVVVLDEPDVFLHPDLQRRLARTLFGRDQQTVVATHSIEILAEAEPGSAVWVDRSRRTAERPSADGSLALAGRRLGSGYELGVGRALRSRVVLFVEGDDAPILAILAKRLGLDAVAASERYATVPLGGFSKNWRASAFSETMSAMGADVTSFVLLDSDLRASVAIQAEVGAIRSARTKVHVWSRRELENYLISPGAVSRTSGLPLSDVTPLLDEIVDEMRPEALLALQTQRLDEKRMNVDGAGRLHDRTVLQLATAEFDQLWAAPLARLGLIDAKLAIRSLNARLQQVRAKTLNAHSLARKIPLPDLDTEVSHFLQTVNSEISAH